MQQFAQQPATGAPLGETAGASFGKEDERQKGTRVIRVQIYLSDFGKDRIEQEKIKGPAIVRRKL